MKDALRKRSEELIDSSTTNTTDIEEDARVEDKRLLHELRVHQIELEMQNEELINSRCMLEKSNEKYKRLYNYSPISIVTLDEAGCIIEYNLYFKNMFMESEKILQGKPFISYVCKESHVEFYTHLRRVMEENEHKTNIRLRCTEKLFQAQIQSIKTLEMVNSKEIRRCLMTIIDIEGQQQMMRNMEKSRIEAINASNLKSQFLANMSHEIRTPINGISGFVQLLEMSGLNESQMDYLKYINQSIHILLDVINDILDISKLEAKMFFLEESAFDLWQLLENVISLFGIMAKEKGLILTTDFDPDLPKQLIGDSVRLRQVFSNLLGNAVKFTEKGEINLSGGVNSISEDFCELFFKIRDTGIGISPENHTRIFEPFTQADNSTTRKYGGTGLGLSICKKIIEKAGGTIWTESKDGKGSLFTFTIRLMMDKKIPGDG